MYWDTHGCIDYIIADSNVSIFIEYVNDQEGKYLHIDLEWSIKYVLLTFSLWHIQQFKTMQKMTSL